MWCTYDYFSIRCCRTVTLVVTKHSHERKPNSLDLVKWRICRSVLENSPHGNPIIIVVVFRKCDLARFLVEHGADATAHDKQGLTPLHWVSFSGFGNADVARFLIEHADDDATAQDKHESRTDHWQLCYIGASVNDHVDLARFLVEHGAKFRFLAPRLCLSRGIKPPDASWTPISV